VGADAHGDEPVGFAFLGALGQRLRVTQAADIDLVGLGDFGRVRLRMNTGCLRNMPLIAWPGWIALISISVELSARTSAEGAIWLTSG
jgi:hypothetical protein